jgi:predicted TIM-barrel fold metal-dependent hydrolase
MSAMPVLPPGACDCHTHVFGDPGVYPMIAARHYTPGPASVDDLRAHLARLGLSRVVLVQPSVYGTDNRLLLHALDALDGIGRGIAVLDPSVSEAELDALHARGVRGVRLNVESSGAGDPGQVRIELARWADRTAARGWHIQLFAALDTLMTLADELADLAVPPVLDHFAMIRSGMEPTAGPARTLLDLMVAGRVHVKLSGAYRIGAPGEADALARRWSALYRQAAPGQLLWASDWPHTAREPGRHAHEISGYREVPSEALARSLAEWLPDEHSRQRVLVDNPAALYDF